ncbi:uncharacterized protein BKA78DRAFT_354532 [Phyllosticta capitalensis]|uniref:uncharacterized protein n=1 Tax=Phyllosticta capitalensis TaxID=121624 RepID=UPI00312E8665
MPRLKTSLEPFNATDIFYPGDNGRAARNFPTSLFPTSTIAIMDMAIPNSCAHPHRTPMLAIKSSDSNPIAKMSAGCTVQAPVDRSAGCTVQGPVDRSAGCTVQAPVDRSAGCTVQKNEPVEEPLDASAGCTVM